MGRAPLSVAGRVAQRSARYPYPIVPVPVPVPVPERTAGTGTGTGSTGSSFPPSTSSRALAFLALCGALLVAAPAVVAQPISEPGEIPDPRRAGGWIVDMADVLSPETEARVERLIDGLKADLTVEVAVVTIHQTPTTPKDLATALFNHWGIGARAANNGLLVLLVLGQRRLEVETGYGLEPVLPDGWLATMQRDAMVPHFKAGDFGAGIEAGMQKIADRLRARPADAARGTGGPVGVVSSDRPASRSLDLPLWLLLLLGGGGFFGLCFGLQHLRMRRHRRCSVCERERRLLDDVEDDAHLEAGRIAEEVVGSVDWKVYVCDGCGSTSVYEDGSWFSGYSDCTSCSYKTMATSSRTTSSPTRYSTGSARVTEDCSHCGYHNSWTKTLPRLPEPSTSSSSSSSSWSSSSSSSSWSSSSSSSSFGGGSSGGGGAGSSW